MIFIANNDGTIAKVVPSVITQGSNLTQNIFLICPFSKFTAVDTIFILPNGAKINGGVMTPSTPTTIDDCVLNTFDYHLTNSITNFNGIVQVIFKCYNTNNEILATYTSQFMVVKSTKPILPEPPEVAVYEQLLSAFAYITGRINNGEVNAKSLLPYDNTWNYDEFSLVFAINSEGYIDFYISLVDLNIDNDLTDETKWKKIDNYCTKDYVDNILGYYYTKIETNTILENYYTKVETTDILNGYYTKVETNEIFTDYYTKNETDTEIVKLENKVLPKDFNVLVEKTIANLTDLVAIRKNDSNYKMSLETLKTYLVQDLVRLRFNIIEDLPEIGIANIIYLKPLIAIKQIYPTFEDFPETGAIYIRYIAEDTSKWYLWDEDTEEYYLYNAGFVEYIWLDELSKYEILGTSIIDLSGYILRAELEFELEKYYTKTEIDELLSGKEPKLPTIPEFPENKVLALDEAGNKTWKEISVGASGFAFNVYLSNDDSDIEGYKKLKSTLDELETEFTKTANNAEKLMETFLFDTPLGVSVIDAGTWSANIYCKVSDTGNTTRFKLQPFLYHIDGTETNLFTEQSQDINNTGYSYVLTNYNMSTIECSPTDRMGVRVSMITNRTSPTSLYFKTGNGYATYVNVPLALRHIQLRQPNEDPNYQHITTEEKGKISLIDNKLDKNQTTANENKTMTVNAEGNIVPTDFIYLGDYKIYNDKEDDSLVFEYVIKEDLKMVFNTSGDINIGLAGGNNLTYNWDVYLEDNFIGNYQGVTSYNEKIVISNSTAGNHTVKLVCKLANKDYCARSINFNSYGNDDIKECYGYGTAFTGTSTMPEYCYYMMFYGCTNLTTAPELPATTLAEYCYSQMFLGCTSLTTAPVLPATTLAIGCYMEMFYDCTNLTTAPELPATTLAEYCYASMFRFCTSLTEVRCYYTSDLSSFYAYNWLYGINTVGKLYSPSAVVTYGMPATWTAESL